MGHKTLFLLIAFASWPGPGDGCRGRKVLTDETGVIMSGEAKKHYPSYARCEWLIDAGNTQRSILLDFDYLDTECSYDFLFVYNGPSYNSPMLASLSGENIQDPIVATSGQMLIYLFSDRNYELNGFSAKYTIQDCPRNCSDRGVCIKYRCVCDTQYTGVACETEVCPNECGDYGHCNTTDDDTTRCHCDEGYSGHMCNISLNDNVGSEYWYELAVAGSGFESRTAHAGAYLPQTNCLYIFGGFTLNNILNDLKVFCLEHNQWEDKPHTTPWPDGRHEHSIAQYGYGFYMFGGILANGSFSNEFWYYNASEESWRLCAENSTKMPLKVSGHTLTVVEDEIYLFGGKTEDGLFWSNMYKITAADPLQWTEITANGGKSSERRLVGHSTVYHKESKSLLIYGGYSYSPDQPRYGTHTNNLHAFHIEHKIWSNLNSEDTDVDQVPKQRSFHTAQIIGNYMVVFGGNTHIHNKLELCYDYKFYLYHLECHNWVRIDLLMGKYTEELKLLFHKGRVGHISAVAYGNIMLVAGGYSGRVLGDLIAFKFPSFVAPPQSEASLNLDYCNNYTRVDKCGYNPDCFYCDNVTTTNTFGCIHRSLRQLCERTKDYYPNVKCSGICSALRTCVECLSQGQGASLSNDSRQIQMYIQPCNWCVKEGKCQDHKRPAGTCLSPTQTVTGKQGWWSGLSASLSTVDQCRDQDYPAGLQSVKYRHIQNISQPDEVKIVRETTEIEVFRRIYNTNLYSQGPYMDGVHWIGFVHPNNATVRSSGNPFIDAQGSYMYPNNMTIKQMLDTSVFYTLKIAVENISVNVFISRDESSARAEKVVAIANVNHANKRHRDLEFDSYQDGTPLFFNHSHGNRYFMDVMVEHVYPKNSAGMELGLSMYSLDIKWNGINQTGKPKEMKLFHPFSYEFLEPYNNGDCSPYTNCLACMTDTFCGWCDSDDTCILRNTTTGVSECNAMDRERLLITDASMCPMCPDHVECNSCAADPLCEWMTDHVCCVRRGRVDPVSNRAITTPEECYAGCHGRNSCNVCMTRRECAWCENLQTCLPFSDYVSRHRHGQCTEWIDSEESGNNPYTCKDCAAKATCDLCLATFSCGWCGNTVDPRYGLCVEGDFIGPYSSSTCSAMVHSVHTNFSISTSADWSYGMCPDVEECLLGLAHCHPNATCINTPRSYNCSCNRGFMGDGRVECEKTCFHKCVRGECMVEDDGEFNCDCDLGWTGLDCSEDCRCNKHSMCYTGTGKCDHCLNGTTGPFCNSCRNGHFGDPTKPDGCYRCHCNEHGDPDLGLCLNETGECFCVDNTIGFDCEQCQDGYYGDPRDGGKCYLHCDHGLIVENITSGSLGSHKGPGVSTWRAYCLWILTVYPVLDKFWRPNRDPHSITLTMEDLEVECEMDHVYVYDGIPTFVDATGSGVLLGAFCGFHHGKLQSVTAKSGILTVYFTADISGNFSRTREFNTSYTVNTCMDSCPSNRMCVGGVCVCKPGFMEPDCSKKICHHGCEYIEVSNSCRCEADFGATPYELATYPWDVNSSVFTSQSSSGPISRYGHVWINCGDEIAFMFGGRSLQQGLLNDIWQYDFITHTWSGIVPITDDKPSGRYFHAGACVLVLKHLYVFGGLVESTDHHLSYVASKQMWKFAIDNKKWTGPIEPAWVNGVAGHSMTVVQETILVIIGGFSTTKYFSDTVYKYDANSYLSAWRTYKLNNATGDNPTGIYGHSAVYNQPTDTIYIYGGHIYKDERLLVSEDLFTYSVDNNWWNILQPEPKSNLESRYFHTAVGFSDYMLVIGGFTHHKNTSVNVLIYRYECNFWYKLDLTGTTAGKVLSSLVGAQAIKYNDSVYITGGYNNMPHNEVYQVTFPLDICSLNGDATTCVTYPGCSALIVQNGITGNATLCYNSKGKAPARQSGTSVAELPGQQCNVQWHAERNCNRIVNCSQCVAVYPQFKHAEPLCVWCSTCRLGQCIPRGHVCKASDGVVGCHVIYSNETNISYPKAPCAVSSCAAATCDRCKELRCMWTRHFQRILHRAGEISRSQSFTPTFDWTCVLSSLGKNLDGYKAYIVSPSKCPAPCYVHRSCKQCLESLGGEGGAKECYWSETLKECIPPAYLSLHCAGGECGTILQGGSQKCPLSCAVNKKCADCRKAPGCGWCAFGGLNGLGVCMAGKRNAPSGDSSCALNNVQPLNNEDLSNFRESKTSPDWTYATCPPEDECSNGHHSCDSETQNCKDKLTGFVCECKPGYVWKEEQQICMPVCHSGCIHGVCTQPDKCQCYFGYVGRNCSTKCDCNRHSNCESISKKDVCLECMNNTQGQHCQECKPLFVGNPHGGGRCVSCTEFCNYHTDICLYWTDYNSTYKVIRKKLQNISENNSHDFLSKVAQLLSKGPENRDKTHCVDCRHHTHRSHCDECEAGYFRLNPMIKAEPCIKCMCNGHSDVCDRDWGQNCQCQNNTETRCNSESKDKKISCHEVQCAVCKEYFLGTPTNGHQCFRQMHVNREYCFDPNTQSECLRKPTPLVLGHTVFFAVQPKYVNVDIRVTIDVSQGGVDVYFSPNENTFSVNVDKVSGMHNVRLDNSERVVSVEEFRHSRLSRSTSPILEEYQHRRRNSNQLLNVSTGEAYYISEIYAKDINTFITVDKPNTVLVIRDVKFRLVITLPNDLLDLRTSRFYITFASIGDTHINKTVGSLYFRQDQPHIDLFVFFSVFFSCFFLFLAMCVLLWKTKQAFDARRTRQQRAREMQHMASRPFAKVLVLIEHSPTPYNVSPRLHLRSRAVKVTVRTPLLPSEINLPQSLIICRDSSLGIVPIAIEPADDGVADVGTVVFQLPGGATVPSQLCLGSTLTKGWQLTSLAGKSRRPPTSSLC